MLYVELHTHSTNSFLFYSLSFFPYLSCKLSGRLQISEGIYILYNIIPEVMRTVCEGTVGSVLDAVTSDISLIHARTGLIVSQMVASLCVTCRPVQVGTTGGDGGRRGEMGGRERGKERKREKEGRVREGSEEKTQAKGMSSPLAPHQRANMSVPRTSGLNTHNSTLVIKLWLFCQKTGFRRCTRHSTTHTHVHADSLVSVGTDSCVLIVQCAVDVRTVVEGSVSSFDRPSTPLVHEVPVETGERPVLVALVLQECLTLLHSELLQVPGRREERCLGPAMSCSSVTKASGASSNQTFPSPPLPHRPSVFTPPPGPPLPHFPYPARLLRVVERFLRGRRRAASGGGRAGSRREASDLGHSFTQPSLPCVHVWRPHLLLDY